MGQKLASTLNSLINSKATDDLPRADIVANLAEAAGLEVDAVEEILQGETSPPLEDLRGFAQVLDVDPEELLEDEEEPVVEPTDSPTIREVIPAEKYQRLMRIKEELERALDS
jgi:transcriptional regulator with XRE-family HTH domain